MTRIVFEPEAESDLARMKGELVEKAGTRIAEAFGVAISSRLTMIRRHPESSEKRLHDVRCVVVRRFRCLLFYVYRRDEVRVLAVLHSSQNPKGWPRS